MAFVDIHDYEECLLGSSGTEGVSRNTSNMSENDDASVVDKSA